jgi:hypothetical protein
MSRKKRRGPTKSPFFLLEIMAKTIAAEEIKLKKLE